MKISKSTIIDAPASFVFQILMDMDLATAWVPSLLSYMLISGSENMVGSTYRSQFNMNGTKFEQISELKSCVKNQSVQWLVTSSFTEGKVEYFLSPISESQTELKYVSESQYKGLTKLLARLLKSTFRKINEDYLTETHRNLKTLVEVEYQSQKQSEFA